jgi:hypothetical protein
MKIFTAKTKVMTFQGDNTVRVKIIIQREVTEQVKHFAYHGA